MLKRLLIFFSLLFVGMLPNAPQAATLSFDAFIFTPYSNPYSHGGGICAEVIRQAFKRVNVDVTIAYHHFRISYDQTKSGQAVGFFPLYKTGDVSDNHFLFTDTLVPFKLFAYKKKVSAYAEEINGETAKDSSKKMLICIPDGYSKVSALKAYLAENNYDKVIKNSPQECFIELEEGRVNAVIDDELNMHAVGGLVFSSPDLLTTLSDTPIYEGGYNLAIDAKLEGAKDILETFNRGLEDLKSTGDYETILQRFQVEAAINS